MNHDISIPFKISKLVQLGTGSQSFDDFLYQMGKESIFNPYLYVKVFVCNFIYEQFPNKIFFHNLVKGVFFLVQ
jgi:hypothetical protein